MSKPTVTIVTGQAQNIAYQVNKVADQLAEAIADRLMLDGSEPMQGNLDMNNHSILNLLALVVHGDLEVQGKTTVDEDLDVSGSFRLLGALKNHLDMGGYKIVNLGTGSDSNDAAKYSQIQALESSIKHIQNETNVVGYRHEYEFIANEGDDTFTCDYDPGYLDVFVNGWRLATNDYNASTGTEVVLINPVGQDDVVNIVAYGAFGNAANIDDTATTTNTTWSSDKISKFKAADAELLDGKDSTYFATASGLSSHISDTTNPHSVTASQIGASNILTELKTVDGAGSGLDADLLDNKDSTRYLNRGSTGTQYSAGANTITFTETNNVSSAGAVTIDWRTSNKQQITLTEDTTFSFTDPSEPCNLVLRIIQDATGGWAVTMPTLLTPGGTALSFSTAANAVDLLMLYFDGANYVATILNDIK